MTAPNTAVPLHKWQQAAITVLCQENPCDLHKLLAERFCRCHRKVDRNVSRSRASVRDEEICALIQSTVGCPLFRDLQGVDAFDAGQAS